MLSVYAGVSLVSVVDVGTGSGAIAVSLALELGAVSEVGVRAVDRGGAVEGAAAGAEGEGSDKAGDTAGAEVGGALKSGAADRTEVEFDSLGTGGFLENKHLVGQGNPNVSALDISNKALVIAKSNAQGSPLVGPSPGMQQEAQPNHGQSQQPFPSYNHAPGQQQVTAPRSNAPFLGGEAT